MRVNHDVSNSKCAYQFLSSTPSNSYAPQNLPEKVRSLTMQETIHTRIRESRIEAGLSQAKVGRELGISREAVGQWEKVAPGKKPTIPKKQHLDEFGRLVNRNPEWLETGKGPKEYPPPPKEVTHLLDANYGWICPICGRVNAPQIQSCPSPHDKN